MLVCRNSSPFVWLVSKKAVSQLSPKQQSCPGGCVRDARGSEGPLVLVSSLQTDTGPVVPTITIPKHSKAFQVLSSFAPHHHFFVAVVFVLVFFQLQFMQNLPANLIVRKHCPSPNRLACYSMQLIRLFRLKHWLFLKYIFLSEIDKVHCWNAGKTMCSMEACKYDTCESCGTYV